MAAMMVASSPLHQGSDEAPVYLELVGGEALEVEQAGVAGARKSSMEMPSPSSARRLRMVRLSSAFSMAVDSVISRVR